ncbi:OmpP1/FadL family transporter [Prosthecochloris sp. GSB1]|uniref:OmpP1/FadL family transporter n=1 Tax=Prosthecochloris sp. GSB1 TaxID=281093 RepID=UPI00300239D3
MKSMWKKFGLAVLLSIPSLPEALATDGMNLEGYGAKSHAMGGTGMAFDTGNSAVMNNPATLGLMKEGSGRLGIGIRGLHPHVSAWYAGTESHSNGDSYYMPSISWIRRDGRLSYGVAMLAQGGMGTEYGNDSPLFQYGMSLMGIPAQLSGEDIRSEVSMGRVMFPVAWSVGGRTTIGGSLDIVWASMDVRMDMDGARFGSMLEGNGGEVGGSMLGPFIGLMDGSTVTDINYARFDFSNDSEFAGEADGYGFGLKAGIVHRLSDIVSIGASYHSQTHISDLETSEASLSFDGGGLAFGSGPLSLKGALKVRDFEWPETIAAGIAVRPNGRWLLSADVKLVNWSAVMEHFRLEFTADDSPENGAFAGERLDVSMDQDWDDQFVFGVGAEYAVSRRLKLRAGARFANNPVPDKTLNPLFPAITTTHYTCGFGWNPSGDHRVAFALAIAPEHEDTSIDGVRMTHGQTNWSMNYAYDF